MSASLLNPATMGALVRQVTASITLQRYLHSIQRTLQHIQQQLTCPASLMEDEPIEDAAGICEYLRSL